MPPLLALALCAAFVIFLMRLDRKRSPAATRALWIPTIWLIYVSSKPIGSWLQIERTNLDASSAIDQIFAVVLMLLALAVLVKRKPPWTEPLRQNAWLVVLIAFMLLSVIWSDIPGTSVKRWLRELQAVAMALVVFSEPLPRQSMVSLLRRMAYVLIPFSLMVIKYFPIYGVEYGTWSGSQMWIGVAQQKNSLALICAASAVFLIWSLARGRQGVASTASRYQTLADVVILFLAFYLLAGPQHSPFYSATSTYALLAGLAVCAWVYIRARSHKEIRAGLLLAALSLVMVTGLTSVFLGGSGIRFFASSAGRDATLTGRTEIWASLLPVVKANPLIGKGFGGFWTSRTRDLYRISGAHSGYLDVLLGTGFVGLVTVSLFLISSCQKAVRGLQADLFWGLLWIFYLFLSVVHNIGESSIDSFTSPLSAILLFLAVSSATANSSVDSKDVTVGEFD